MIHRELILKTLLQENSQRSGQEIVLDEVKNCAFHLLTLKEASNVFWSVQRHGSRRNKIIYHAEAWCLSRVKVLERVFQLRQKLRIFLDQKGHPLSINFQGNFWLYLNLNSLLCIVQPFTDEEFDLGCTPVATETQKTALTRHTKLNESWSCTLRSCTTPSVN